MVSLSECIEMELERLKREYRPFHIAKITGMNPGSVWRYMGGEKRKVSIPLEFIKKLEECGLIYPLRVFMTNKPT